jgi:MFS family permease
MSEPSEPTNLEKMRGLPWSIAGSVSTAVFNQFTFFGSGYVLFLNALGFNESQIGFLLSLLSFLGALAFLLPSWISRMGYKRAFVRFWSLRNLTPGFLVLAPWILQALGQRTVLVYTAAVILAFGFFRTIAETALLSWQQEYIPRSIQGKFFATNNIFVNFVSILAVAAASAIIGAGPGLQRFIVLFSIAVLFGQLSAWLFGHVPGGKTPGSRPERVLNLSGLQAPLQDRNFTRFLAGVALIIIGTGSLGSFLPLFLRDKVGLGDGMVVLLQTGTLLGGLFSSYLWGWTADRYGSRPVMLSGIYLLAVLPVIWFLLPRQSALSFPIAMVSFFLQGTASLGWGIGMSRLFFVSVVPPDRKADYMAVYYSCISLTTGFSALIGGWILEMGKNISGLFLIFPLDAYLLLFGIGLTLPAVSVLLFSRVRGDSDLTTSQLAGLFLRGNPILAFESLISFRAARDERTMIASTERLGKAQSPLTVEELLDALSDPRFNVRFEAIVSIARRAPDDRLLKALGGILNGSDPALAVIAAWALGRIGDARASGPLREGLFSNYRSVQVHCARSLGALKDPASTPLLLERLEGESDHGLQLAYASALGHLREARAVKRILEILSQCQDPTACGELALSLARIVGNEHGYIQLYRQMQDEPGSGLSRYVSGSQRYLRRMRIDSADIHDALNAGAQALAREDLETGTACILQASRLLLTQDLESACREILQACAWQFENDPTPRQVYLVLAVCTLSTVELKANSL